MSLISKVNDDRSLEIPEEIIKKAGLKPGTEIIWLYDVSTSQILLMEKPIDFAKSLKGLGKEIWKDIDVNDYVKEERNSWKQ